ncbi:hypothetical protein BPAE_0003g00230 [Botrytis paeoniae]|uniref:RING-type domain-containing protein n=1 Tax=Botrytis paeoniae TaxID=278948 RepID=A0A4Z1G6T0_9HELO|nr:hypothetical protein BPAE_0003g00230 [Botrytis paeoniae]
MVYRSRLPEIIYLLCQEGRHDELRFRRDLQRYWPEIRAEFHNLLTLDLQNEMLERFVFSLTFGHGSRFPGDMELDHLPMLPDPADGGYPPHSLNDDFILFGIPPCSQFATVFLVPTTSQSHVYDNRRRANDWSLEAATLRSAILLPQTDDSQDHDSQDHDFEDTHDQYDDSQHNDGQHDDGQCDDGQDNDGQDVDGQDVDGQDVDRQDDDGSTTEILAANSAPEDDDICPICREGYSDAQPSASLVPNCGHFFHLGCMVQWISSDSIDGQLRDRCICCRRKYTGILSQFYGEVTPPQNGENFWRNDNGPLISEVFPRREILSPFYSSNEIPSPHSSLDDDISYNATDAEVARAFHIGEYTPNETNDGTASYFEVPPGQGARKDQAESQD